MKSMWIALLLMRSRSSVADRDRVGVAEREVARRVLVEQRVEERRCPSCRCGPRGRRARPRRAATRPRPWRSVPAARRRRRRRSRRRGRPRSGRGGRATTRAADVERLRRGDHAVGAQRVGCGRRSPRSAGSATCTMPSTVCMPGVSDAKREVGSRPTVRSVPGPSKRSASKRCSSRRAPASCSCPSRAHATRRRRRARRAAARRSSCSQSWPAPSRRRARGGRDAPIRASPTGRRPVRRLRVDHVEVLARAPAARRARRRAGSMPSRSPGGTCGVIEMRDAVCPRRASSRRWPYQRRDEIERVRVARSSRSASRGGRSTRGRRSAPRARRRRRRRVVRAAPRAARRRSRRSGRAGRSRRPRRSRPA